MAEVVPEVRGVLLEVAQEAAHEEVHAVVLEVAPWREEEVEVGQEVVEVVEEDRFLTVLDLPRKKRKNLHFPTEETRTEIVLVKRTKTLSLKVLPRKKSKI